MKNTMKIPNSERAENKYLLNFVPQIFWYSPQCRWLVVAYLPRRFAASVNTTNTSHLRDLQVTTSCGYPVLVRLQISKKNPTSKKVRLALNCGGSRGGARGPGSPLIFRPNCGSKGWKKILRPPPPPMSGSGWPGLPPSPSNSSQIFTPIQ